MDHLRERSKCPRELRSPAANNLVEPVVNATIAKSPSRPRGHAMPVAEHPRFCFASPAAVYHAKANDYLSSHQLADFRKCPLLYRRKRLGHITEEERPAYLVGRAAHTLILEGARSLRGRLRGGRRSTPRRGDRLGPARRPGLNGPRLRGSRTGRPYFGVIDLGGGFPKPSCGIGACWASVSDARRRCRIL